MYKLFITDLDGSIIDGSEVISTKNLKAIKILRENNIEITIATGRRWSSISKIVEPLSLTLPVILYNGAGIYDPLRKSFLYLQHLSKEEVIGALKVIHYYLSFVKLGIYHDDKLYEDSEALEFLKDNKNGIIKIFIEGEKELLKELKNRLEKIYLNVVFSSYKYLEILPKGASKGKALKKLLKNLDIKLEEVIALGDYDNDEEMLKLSGLGITLKNASERLKKIADYVIDASPSESVHYIIQQVLNFERR
ncbi:MULTISPECIES: Cof-type HAD-IIB family hydrolase [Dictyoglomus]|uniref:Cof-type HAD-IIB family hydrolase n=1 Tax=Dictyoglomus TaxID=13 RepID=UPI000CCE78E7|nr:Cof-type HAD-IIB family hydrolase [Dictyoglomus turgidum]PNV79929.1 MAG: Cof-type HAD-IIB family hydrolase [Dictyoglomus turgidum]